MVKRFFGCHVWCELGVQNSRISAIENSVGISYRVGRMENDFVGKRADLSHSPPPPPLPQVAIV